MSNNTTRPRYEPVRDQHEATLAKLASSLRHESIAAEAERCLNERRDSFRDLKEAEMQQFLVRVANAALPPNDPWSRERLSHICGLLVQQRPWSKAPPLQTLANPASAAQSNHGSLPSRSALTSAVKFAQTVHELRHDNRFPLDVREYLDSRVMPLLANAALLPEDLHDMGDALRLKLGIEHEKHHITQTVTFASKAVESLLPDVRNCEYLYQRALEDGEVATAEQVAEGQLQLYERLLHLTETQYDALDHRQRTEDEARRKRRWDVFRAARHDIGAVMRRTSRRMDALENDAARVKYLVEEASQEDVAKGEQYDADMRDVQADIAAVDDHLRGEFKTIEDLVAQLRAAETRIKSLGDDRERLTVKRTVILEEESQRVSSHDSLLFEANDYLSDAKQQMDRLLKALRGAEALQEFVLEGANTVADRQEAASQRASQLTLAINREHLKLLTEYALCLTRHCHRRLNQWRVTSDARLSAEMNLELTSTLFDPTSKKHAMQRDTSTANARDLMTEIDELRDMYRTHAQLFDERCVPHLLKHGVAFVHPSKVAGAALVERREQIVNWRDAVDVTNRKFETALDEERASITEGFRQLRMTEATRRLRASARDSNAGGAASAYARLRPVDESSTAPLRRPRSAVVVRAAGEGTLQEALAQFARMQATLATTESLVARGTRTAAAAPFEAATVRTPQRPTYSTTSVSTPSPRQASIRPTTAPTARASFKASAAAAPSKPHARSDPVAPRPSAAAWPATATESSEGTTADQQVETRADAQAALSDNRLMEVVVPPTVLRPLSTVATAVHTYVATDADELSFSVGDRIVVLGPAEDAGWYRGSCGHRIGVFPANYTTFRTEVEAPNEVAA
jgi:hypothetical protein